MTFQNDYELIRIDESLEKCSILPKFKEGDPAMAGLTTGIHGVFLGLKFEPDAEIEQKGAFYKGLFLYLPPGRFYCYNHISKEPSF